jgi:K+-sensing histidine kinase KdpD
MSLPCVGLVTAVLFLLDHKLTLNLVPVAYLIPVIVAATQWGIWPATLASVAGTGAPDFFFPAGTEGATASIALPGSQTKASGLTNE